MVDPGRWFRARGIQQVLVVGRSADGDTPIVNLDTPTDVDPTRDDQTESEANNREAFSIRLPQQSFRTEAPFQMARLVGILTSGGFIALIHQGRPVWYLVPFVPPVAQERLDQFRAKLIAIGLLKRRQRYPSTEQIIAFLSDASRRRQLKLCYQEIASDHNFVSMTLYAGPPNGAETFTQLFTRKNFNAGFYDERNGWMFTGDTPLCNKRVLTAWAQYYDRLLGSVGFFLAPHHGARYSMDSEVLTKLDPHKVLIAYGRPSAYGHPHSDVTDLCDRRRIDIVRVTDRPKTIFTAESTVQL